MKQHLADGGKMKLGGLLAGCLLFLEVRPLALSCLLREPGGEDSVCLWRQSVQLPQDNVVGGRKYSRSASLATNQPRVCMTLSICHCHCAVIIRC